MLRCVYIYLGFNEKLKGIYLLISLTLFINILYLIIIIHQIFIIINIYNIY